MAMSCSRLDDTVRMTWLLPSGTDARRVGTILGAVTALVMFGFLAAFTVHRFTPVDGWKELFDIGAEANIPTWWNTTLLFMVAMFAILASEVARGSGPAVRRAWWVVAAGATYASIDEAAGLHERLAGPVESAGIQFPTYASILPGVVIAVVGAAVLVTSGRRLPRPTAGRLGVALACYGLAAVGVEAVNGWTRDHNWDNAYTVGTIVEESVEMGSCVYAVAAIVDAFQWRRICTGLEVVR